MSNEWRYISGTDQLYRVFPSGQIQSAFVKVRDEKTGRYCWGVSGAYRDLHPTKATLKTRATVTLFGKKYNFGAIMLETFVGPRPKNYQVSHLDGNPNNNSIKNLRWESAKDNNARKKQHGTWQGGSRHGQAKLTEFLVYQLRLLRRIDASYSQKDLAIIYGIKQKQVSYILNRKAWVHVGPNWATMKGL